MTPHLLQVDMDACSVKWAAECLSSKRMLKQVVSFNAYVSLQTLSYSSCDGLCTDQNDTAAMFIFLGDIAVVCSKLSQTSQHPNTKYQATSAEQCHGAKRRRHRDGTANASSLVACETALVAMLRTHLQLLKSALCAEILLTQQPMQLTSC
jgi:hypothetical protein